MKTNRPHRAILAIAASLSLLSLTGVAACDKSGGSESKAKGQLTIGFSVPVLANPYWKSNVDFARKMGEQLGVKVIVADAQEREDNQLKNIQDLIAQGVDGIVFGPTTAEIGPALLKACQHGGVVCAAAARKPGVEPTTSNSSYYAGYVVGDDAGDGALGAKALGAAGCKKAVAMSGLQGNSVADARLNGFMREAKAQGIRILGTPQRPVELPESGLKATKNFLAKFPGPQFDCLWAFNDGSAIGAIRALKDAGADTVKVASVDGTTDGVKAISSGRMLISPGGEFINGGLALIMTYDTIKGSPRKNRDVTLQPLEVNKGNVNRYRQQFLDKLPDYDATKLSKAKNPSAAEDALKIVLTSR